MGRRGPAPTPTKILALRGSPRGSKNPKEPRPAVECPPAPTWIGEDARKVYDIFGARLLAVGLMTAVDENALARYAVLWVRYRRCEEFVAKHGEAYPVRARQQWSGEPGQIQSFKSYPQAKMALGLAAELLRLEREFGLTPAARARLTAEVPIEDEAPTTSFDYFGGGAKTG